MIVKVKRILCTFERVPIFCTTLDRFGAKSPCRKSSNSTLRVYELNARKTMCVLHTRRGAEAKYNTFPSHLPTATTTKKINLFAPVKGKKIVQEIQ